MSRAAFLLPLLLLGCECQPPAKPSFSRAPVVVPEFKPINAKITAGDLSAGRKTWAVVWIEFQSPEIDGIRPELVVLVKPRQGEDYHHRLWFGSQMEAKGVPYVPLWPQIGLDSPDGAATALSAEVSGRRVRLWLGIRCLDPEMFDILLADPASVLEVKAGVRQLILWGDS